MKTSNVLIWLAVLVVVLALFATGVGLLYQDGGNARDFTTLHGGAAQIYGQGLYSNDTRLIATGYRVQDTVVLFLGVPLLVISIALYRRGSLRGAILLTGMLVYFLYNYGSMAFGAAYNNLFLVYVAIFSASLFGLTLALTSFDLDRLPARFSQGIPRRAIAVFMIVSGLILGAVWLFLSILPALLAGKAPAELESYTTGVTWVVDMGVVAPALIVTGVLVRRRAPLGDLLAAVLLVFSAVLGIQLAAMGIIQFTAGLFGIGQFIGMVVSFAILAAVALWLTIVVLRHVSDAVSQPASQLRRARA